MNALKPVGRAFADARLQILARPLVFLAVWFLLTLLPQLILGFAFQETMNAALDTLFRALAAGGDPGQLSPEDLDIIARGFRVMVVMILVMALLAVYLGSVLAGIVHRFRDRSMPNLASALQDGLRRFPGFLRAVLAAVLRILMLVIPGYLVGIALGVMLGDPLLMPIALMGLMAFVGFLHFGLGPFIHLALGLSGSDSVKLSRVYYRTHRPLVSGLFLAIVLLPMVVISTLNNLVIRSEVLYGVGVVILGLLQSIALFAAAVVYINFAMNAFPPDPDSELDPSL